MAVTVIDAPGASEGALHVADETVQVAPAADKVASRALGVVTLWVSDVVAAAAVVVPPVLVTVHR